MLLRAVLDADSEGAVCVCLKVTDERATDDA